MIESSNPNDYRFSSIALRNHLLKSQIDKEYTFPCEHPEWFDEQIYTRVDSTICRFCGIKNSCNLYKSIASEFVTIHGFPGDSLPGKEVFEDCFSAEGPDGEAMRIDPFKGFSFASSISRDLFAISLSSFETFFPESSVVRKSSADSLQYAVGYDRKYGLPLWPMDQRFLQARFEYEKKFEHEISQLSHQTSDRNELLDSELDFLYRIAKHYQWIYDSEEDLRPLLREVFTDLSRVLSKIIPIRKMSKISMKPFIDTPLYENCSGTIELAIRWVQLVPTDIENYIRKRISTSDKLQLIIDRMLPETKEEILKADTDKKYRYLPRFPMVLITNKENLSLTKLDYFAGRVIDVVIADVHQPFFLIDGLGTNIWGMWTDD